MSLRKIRFIGDEMLRKKSRSVDIINSRITELLDDMAETMRSRDGVGLAAPQVGVLRRVAVIGVNDKVIELINPQIIKAGGNETMTEGCLSVPDRIGDVERPLKVTVKALDRHGKSFEIDAEGYLARAVCHEIDHLDGIIFLDKAIDIRKKE